MSEKRSILQRLKAVKPEYLIAGAVGIVVLGIWGSTFVGGSGGTGGKATPAPSATPTDTDASQVEEKLGQTLSAINGAGKVEVMITYESGPEIVPAVNQDRQSTDTQEDATSGGQRSNATVNESQKTVTVQGAEGSEPLIIKELNPEVRGVVIVAEGAGDLAVRMDLMRAAQTVLNVPLERVEVFEMKRSETHENSQ